jgi:phytoene dehydrogenase-like protein
VFSLEALFTPYAVRGGWPNSSEPQRWLEAYASRLDNGPEFLAGIGAHRAMTPDRYERDLHMPQGHATSFGGRPLATVLGRPRELTRYRTGVPGLFLTGAATFPGAGVWGASGRNCAKVVLASR